RYGPLAEHLGAQRGRRDPRRGLLPGGAGVALADLLERLRRRQLQRRHEVPRRHAAAVVRLATHAAHSSAATTIHPRIITPTITSESSRANASASARATRNSASRRNRVPRRSTIAVARQTLVGSSCGITEIPLSARTCSGIGVGAPVSGSAPLEIFGNATI